MNFFRSILASVVLLCASLSPVRAAEAEIPGREEMLLSLTDQIAQHFSVADDLQLDFSRAWKPPFDDLTGIHVEVTRFSSMLATSMLVQVRYTKNKEVLKDEMISLSAQLWRETLLARSPMSRGDDVDAQQFEIRRVDALREHDVVGASAVPLGEYVLTRSIPSGHCLVWRDLTRRSLVKKGEFVSVDAISGMLSITMKAQALQDGAKGDIVRLRNLESSRDFTAQVIDEGRAVVQF